METIRSFIAIELPDTVKSTLNRIQQQLKDKNHTSVKWVDPNSIHLTLKFLGDVDKQHIQSIADSIKEAVKETIPFTLMLDKVGVFPNPKNPRVIWVGVAGELNALHNIQLSIEKKLTPLGFSPEKRGFSPHLTLGRVRDKVTTFDRARLGEAISHLEIAENPKFKVQVIHLIQSILSKQGAIYSHLFSTSLKIR